MRTKLLLFSVFVILPSIVYAGQVSFSTYYPSPFGAYDRLKLVPRGTLDAGNCDEANEYGTFYYESGVGLRFCDEALGWQPIAGGAWTQSGNNLYPNNLATNVGIGTDTPNEEFHVGQTAGNVALRLGNLGNNDWDLIRSVGDDSIPSGNFAIRRVATTTPSVTVNTLSNVGIGTANPGRFFTMANDTFLTVDAAEKNPLAEGTAFLELTGKRSAGTYPLSTPAAAINFGHEASGVPHNIAQIAARIGAGGLPRGDFSFYTADGTSLVERIRIKYDGNVGIGTTTPTARLHINAPEGYTTPGLFLDNADIDVNGSTDGEFMLRNSNTGTTQKIFLGGTSGPTLTVDGIARSVGIGTENPGANKLEVVGGPIKATGGLIIETRTTNPGSPVAGQMWLCTDTAPYCDGI